MEGQHARQMEGLANKTTVIVATKLNITEVFMRKTQQITH